MIKRNKTIWKIMAVVIMGVLLILPLDSRIIHNQSRVPKDRITPELQYQTSSLRIPFLENTGQIANESVAYYAKTFGGTVFVTLDGQIVYSLPRFVNKLVREGWVIKESFVGANTFETNGEQQALTKVSYFKGSDSSKWERNIPTYDRVSLGELYRGVELKLKAFGGSIEKLFYIKPYANLESIRIRVEGAKGMSVNDSGELEVGTGLGVVKFTRPVAYQERNGEKEYINVTYSVNGLEYGFELEEYDRSRELVIDPLLASTFLGGGNDDSARSSFIDSSGNIYVAGYAESSIFPTKTGAYDTTHNGGSDAFISKLDGDLQNLIASTILGGSDDDKASSLFVDSSNNVYVTGWTKSSNFPATSDGYDTTFNGGNTDGFISKLDGDLQILLASTFLGGSKGRGWEIPRSISKDSSGNVIVTGDTVASDFPVTPGAYETTYNGGSNDGFVSKLDSDLKKLLASTFLGGSGDSGDYAQSLFIDSSSNIYVAGWTYSPDFPVTNDAYDTSCGTDGNCNVDSGLFGRDGFVTKLDGDLQNLLASTYLGGSGYEDLHSMTLINGNVFVTGGTLSSDFPTSEGCYDKIHNGLWDSFVTKLDGDLQNLIASTFLGGEMSEYAYSISTYDSERIYVAGRTRSPDFPTTPNAYDITCGTDGNCDWSSWQNPTDAFVSHFDGDLQNLLASTFLGGGGDDEAESISIDSSGDVYIAGYTGSSIFPTSSNAYDATYNGGFDAFISKFDSDLSAEALIKPDISISPTRHEFGSVAVGSSSIQQTFTISNTGEADLLIGTLSITGTNDSEFSTQNDNCSDQTIAFNGSCTVGVIFGPTSASEKSANLTIPSNDPDSTSLNIPLKGIGILRVFLPMLWKN